MRRFRAAPLFVAVLPLAVACATPVGVKRIDPQKVQRELTASVLTSGKLSEPTRIALQRRNLLDLYGSDAARALAELHGIALEGGEEGDLFALAEAPFLHARKSGQRRYHRAAAVYAYAFLFGPDGELAPDPFDPRLRVAADLYNRGITEGFASPDGRYVRIEGGEFALPFGRLEVAFDASSLHWEGRVLGPFTPVADLEVRGLRNRYRRRGLGAPLAAAAPPPEGADAAELFVVPRVQVPVTAFLRIDDPRSQLRAPQLHAILELHPASDRAVRVDGGEVPLEVETTSSLAALLSEAPVWQREIRGFLVGTLLQQQGATQLGALQPYEPGKIPVVFVHGTASSPARWAEMLNDLENDPRIDEHYQFWFFTYDTGNPIVYSASLLRDALSEAVERFDPEGRDPALRRMVLIGHSQGGLLCKLAVVETGSRLWDGVSRVPVEEFQVSDETRALLRKYFFVEPLPFVSRVVFIATPHRGSYVASERVAQLLGRIVSMPARLVDASGEVLTGDRDAMRVRASRLPTSVDNMTPSHPFSRTLSTIPVSDDVTANSIIAVRGTGRIETGNDGVVTYQSAHIEGVESERVVRSGHSVQGHPEAIEEVRRILLLHAPEGAP